MSNITLEEKNRISESNLHLFVERHIHDYWPCATNSARMIDFLQSQYGMTLSSIRTHSILRRLRRHFFICNPSTCSFRVLPTSLNPKTQR